MNIDYADIIQKANARKDALQEFERLLAQSPEHAEQLRKSLSFFSELRTAADALDTEAIALARPYRNAVVDLTDKTVALAQSLNFVMPGTNKPRLLYFIDMASGAC